MTHLKTRSRGIEFAFDRSPDGAIRITFGHEKDVTISADDYARLVHHFRGQTVALGTSRDDPPEGSIGKWLQENVTRTAIASYLGPILVQEGHAVWVDDSKLRFV